jgi:tRNA nucleotidyltransferase (CCA-adding enzyme)
MLKLESKVFETFLTNELKNLILIFKKYDYEIRIAGGAVRDLIMNIIPKDIDLATNATPDEMKIMFEKENIRTLNRNGEKHGTITVRLEDEVNYEITTLRIDVLTDGRHASVEFTNDWKLDANRRDLTINSLFLDFDGNVYDFSGGVRDIELREIHFVGEPDKRIKEDYLRIMRYFRFYGRISLNSDSIFDEKAIEAIRDNAHGLLNVHGERIWVEFKQIVVGRFADVIVSKIIELNVHKYIGFGEKLNLNEFSIVYNRYRVIEDTIKDKHSIQAITLVSTLLDNLVELEEFSKRMKLSNDEKKLSEFIIKYRNDTVEEAEDELKPYKCLLVDYNKDNKISEKITQLLLYKGNFKLIDKLLEWKVPLFPIHGDQIAKLGVPKGPIFSKIINELKEFWKNDLNFNTNNIEILLDRANTIYKQSLNE